MGNKSLSVITINYNNAEGLKQTVGSVLNQSYKDVEYIVIDGNSDDGSVAFLESVKSDYFRFISEPDDGIYNAMNKGIKNASGKYLLFLNSGDFLFDANVLSQVSANFRNNHDIIVGRLKTAKGDITNVVEPPNDITLEYLLTNSLPHPSTFYKSELFEKFGMYNEQNKIVSDWEFNLKLFSMAKINYRIIDQVISVFDLSGISSSSSSKDLMKAEGKTAIKSIFGELTGQYILNSLEKSAYKPSKKKKLLSLLNKLYK